MGKRSSSFLHRLEQKVAAAREAQKQSKPVHSAAKTDAPDMIEKNIPSRDTVEFSEDSQADTNELPRQWEYLVERHPIQSGEKKIDTSDRFARFTREVPEYHLSRGRRGRDEHDRWLNKLGKEGWELVNVRRTVPGESGEIIAELEYIFKRQL